MAAPMPALFFGHGSPMNAIEANPYTRAWAAEAARIPRPRAILAVSAHWLGRGAAVTAAAHPRTIHDFSGFPAALHAVQYPAPGDLQLAQRVADLLAPDRVDFDGNRGLDHGTWSVLAHVAPAADIPVVALRLDGALAPAEHLERGRRLSALRDESVLIVASGNIVHNLAAMSWEPGAPPLAWAERFDARVGERLAAGDDAALAAYRSLDAEADAAVPTSEHYLPLLYVLGTRRPGDAAVSFACGIVGGSISMRSVRIG